MDTYMHMYIHAIHSSRIQASHVDTPTNVTELNWNRVLQPTYVCGLGFNLIDLDHDRVWCVHNLSFI